MGDFGQRLTMIRVDKWKPEAELTLAKNKESLLKLESQVTNARRLHRQALLAYEYAREHDGQVRRRLHMLHLMWRSGWPVVFAPDLCELVFGLTSHFYVRMLRASCLRLQDAVDRARPIRFKSVAANLSMGDDHLLVTTPEGELIRQPYNGMASNVTVEFVQRAIAGYPDTVMLCSGHVIQMSNKSGTEANTSVVFGPEDAVRVIHIAQQVGVQDGRAITWGDDGLAQPVEGPVEVIGVAAGSAFAAWTRMGQIWTWGNRLLQAHNKTVPAIVPGLTNISKVSIGGNVVVAMSDDGSLWWWSIEQSPVYVAATRVSDVAAGLAHMLAVTQAGRLLCWGVGTSGQLGYCTSSTSPTIVDLGCRIATVAAHGNRSGCVTRAGDVLVWGAGQPEAIRIMQLAKTGHV
jgi:hypothetical protein